MIKTMTRPDWLQASKNIPRHRVYGAGWSAGVRAARRELAYTLDRVQLLATEAAIDHELEETDEDPWEAAQNAVTELTAAVMAGESVAMPCQALVDIRPTRAAHSLELAVVTLAKHYLGGHPEPAELTAV